MNKQQLASKIWESANRMRSKIEANEYKDYILGFIFYKFLSDNEAKFLKENDATEDDIRKLTEQDTGNVSWIQGKIGYFIAYNNLFSTWIKKAADFTIADVHDSLSAFSRLIDANHKKVFEGIFTVLDTGLSKLGESDASRSKAVRDLVYLINDIPMDGRQDYDVLGFVYEYLIGMFAANAGKKAGEFYTPHEVSLLMSEIVAEHLKDKQEIKIYDPTSGSGSLLINIGRSVAKHMVNDDKIQYYAQELKLNTYNLTRMNLIMRRIKPGNIFTRNADTLEDDWPLFDETDPQATYKLLRVDAVVSNPPYSQPWDPSDKGSDPRYKDFGLAPKTKADYAFLLHDLYHLESGGIMTIVLPHGVLFRGGEEGQIRKNLVEKGHIDTIIGLPANIFFGTGIPTIIMVLRQKRKNDDVLVVDASRHFTKEGKNNKLQAGDIKRIVDTVAARKTTAHFSRVVPLEEIRANDYNLNIPRYVDSAEPDESWDIYASMFGGIPRAELQTLSTYWDALPGLKAVMFEDPDKPYVSLKKLPEGTTLRDVVVNSSDAVQFKNAYAQKFAGFTEYLEKELIENAEKLNINSEETVIGNDVFNRLDGVPLVDRYTAYQTLDDAWQKISADIELIQSEGRNAVRQVDPNIVIRKKNGKDTEVQDGWTGHIMPFDLVQQTYLAEDLASLTAKQVRASDLQDEYTELIGLFTEEEKESDVLNDDGTAFVPKELAKKVKEVRSELERTGTKAEDGSFESKLLRADGLVTEEKELKQQIKKEADALHEKTKTTIENLTDAQIRVLLGKKWITPLADALYGLSGAQIELLADRLQKLAGKYAQTYVDTAEKITGAEQSLSGMMGDLTGSSYDMKGIAELRKLFEGK